MFISILEYLICISFQLKMIGSIVERSVDINFEEDIISNRYCTRRFDYSNCLERILHMTIVAE
nr:MAG TPA: hypothetical protein [Caudoviricetes sp.]